MVLWKGYVSDEMMGVFAPIFVYWIYAGIYQLLPPSTNRHRLHTLKEEEQKNLVRLPTVIKGVLLQQLVQAAVAGLLFFVTGPESEEVNKEASIPVQVLQMLVGMMVLDTWQYFVHRYMHHNKFLYRHVHSQHHRLVVPCAVGALYNHPLEGLLLDTLGGAISFVIAGMSPQTAVFFFCLATIKTVDDHCGIWHPANIFHAFFENNSAYHDIHHQLQGTKYNYSQPFFSVWDRVMGTHMPYRLVPRSDEEGGGYEARPLKCC